MKDKEFKKWLKSTKNPLPHISTISLSIIIGLPLQADFTHVYPLIFDYIWIAAWGALFGGVYQALYQAQDKEINDNLTKQISEKQKTHCE